MAATSAGRDRVTTRLEGTDCNYCDQGELVDGTYRGNPAVVCEACEAPQVAFF